MVYHRFSAVPCQRHGRGWTWDLDGLVILRRILVCHRFSAVPCQRQGRGWSWDLDGLLSSEEYWFTIGSRLSPAEMAPCQLSSEEYWFTIGSRLSPARDTAEGGLGILMALLSSEEYWFTIGSRLSPARDTAEGGLGILMALLSSEEYWFTIGSRLSPPSLRRIMVYPSVLGCPLPETRPRVDLGS